MLTRGIALTSSLGPHILCNFLAILPRHNMPIPPPYTAQAAHRCVHTRLYARHNAAHVIVVSYGRHPRRGRCRPPLINRERPYDQPLEYYVIQFQFTSDFSLHDSGRAQLARQACYNTLKLDHHPSWGARPNKLHRWHAVHFAVLVKSLASQLKMSNQRVACMILRKSGLKPSSARRVA